MEDLHHQRAQLSHDLKDFKHASDYWAASTELGAAARTVQLLGDKLSLYFISYFDGIETDALRKSSYGKIRKARSIPRTISDTSIRHFWSEGRFRYHMYCQANIESDIYCVAKFSFCRGETDGSGKIQRPLLDSTSSLLVDASRCQILACLSSILDVSPQVPELKQICRNLTAWPHQTLRGQWRREVKLQEVALKHDAVLIRGEDPSYIPDLDVSDVIDIPIPVPADDIDSEDVEDRRKGRNQRKRMSAAKERRPRRTKRDQTDKWIFGRNSSYSDSSYSYGGYLFSLQNHAIFALLKPLS